MIYTGEAARQLYEESLNNTIKYCKGYFFEDSKYIAFDNSRNECFVEEFETENKAICWLENYFEISETEIFNVMPLSKDLYYIPFTGYLKIYFAEDTLSTKLVTL